MAIKSVEDLLVYQKAKRLFEDFIEIDIKYFEKTDTGRVLLSNQLRCIDSICANMEEGYDRKYGKEVKNFFRISKGSAAEALGRYKRLKKLFPERIWQERIAILGEIRAMLHALVLKME